MIKFNLNHHELYARSYNLLLKSTVNIYLQVQGIGSGPLVISKPNSEVGRWVWVGE